MKTAIATIVLVVMLATSVPVSAENTQEGTSSDCLDFEALFLVPGVESPDASYVDEVTPGTPFTIDSEDGTAYVDFFAEDGSWVGWSGEDELVPEDATYGIVCVETDVPVLSGGSWVYVDDL